MNYDLTEENKALAALIKSVEDKVAAAGYAPGVCVSDEDGVWKIEELTVYFVSPSNLRVELRVNKWEPKSKRWGRRGFKTLHNATIVPNPEEQDT